MDEKSLGLILRSRPLTETSLIIHWLTPELGRIATVAKGARRPKSPFRGKLDLFFLADFSFARSRRSELHALREVKLIETHEALRKDMTSLAQAAYAVALLEQTTETETPLGGMFALLRDFLASLLATPAQSASVFAFEMKLLKELGQSPDLSAVSLSAGARQVLQKFAEFDWPALSCVKPSAAQARELQQFLHGFLLHQLGAILPGRARALEN